MLTEALVAGGAETFALRLSDALDRAGTPTTLAVLHPDHVDRRLLAGCPASDVRIAPLPAIRWLKRADRTLQKLGMFAPLRTALTVRWIERVLLRSDVAVVHSHLFGADWIAAELKRRNPRLKIVSTLHGDYRSFDLRTSSAAEGSAPPNWGKLRNRVLSEVDAWVYISDEQRQHMTGAYNVPAEQLHGIYNGVPRPDDAVQPVSMSGPLRIAMAARGTIPEKGWAPLLDAFAQLRGDIRLTLIGEGERLRSLQRGRSPDTRISFVGFQPDPARLIAEADLFVLPTTYSAESLPTVVLEALSVARPVVATDVGEIRAMLTGSDGVAGTLLNAAPPEQLAEQLRLVLQEYVDDRGKLVSHAARAPSAFDRFSMDGCTAAYQQLYAQLAGADPISSSTRSSH